MALLARNICKALSQVITDVPPLLRPESHCVHLRNVREVRKLMTIMNNATAPSTWRGKRSQGRRMFRCLYIVIFLSKTHPRVGNASLLLALNATNVFLESVQTRKLVHVDRGEHPHPQVRLSRYLIRDQSCYSLKKNYKLAMIMQGVDCS